jgi:predicted TIM-barrel fold metal-dependent hydrolase
VAVGDDMAYQAHTSTDAGRRSVTFLPEPPRAERFFTVISVDDHVVEPPDTFAGRVPADLVERAPRVVTTTEGTEAWLYDGKVLPNIGLNAVAGRPPAEYNRDPTNFAEMRRGAWDPVARLADMDLDGVYASLSFPSFIAGFGGARLQTVTSDTDLALATMRAWNDWHLDAWVATSPDRFIPCQITWLLDPALGAKEIERNAVRGFRGLSFPESPHQLGLPSLHTGHWDPILAACQETETVVCLHAGSGGVLPTTATDAPTEITAALFGLSAIMPAVDWLYSLIPVRFPDLKLVLAEGGIGWVAGLLDRLEHLARFHAWYGDWRGTDLTPAEVLARNFWFCALDNPSSYGQLDRIGVEHVLCEVDYPHADSSWPNTQAMLRAQLEGLGPDVVERITWRNAAELFGHPVPSAVQRSSDAF